MENGIVETTSNKEKPENQLYPEPLSKFEEFECIKKLQDGDENARKTLIERNLRLVAYICKKYTNARNSQNDLISIGTIGLIKGVSSFNPNKNVKLSIYLSQCIKNEILMHMRKTKKQNAEISLEETISTGKNGERLTLQAILENKSENTDIITDLDFDVEDLYAKMNDVLNEREKQVLIWRYGLDGNIPKKQKEVAKFFNISDSYVCRIQIKAIEKLKKELLK